MVTVSLPRIICPHCGHVWVPRKEQVKVCRRCQKPLGEKR